MRTSFQSSVNIPVNTRPAVNDDITIDANILAEAASWAMVFYYDSLDVNSDNSSDNNQYQEFEQWQQQSAAHQAAWAKAQAVFQTFEQVPLSLSKKAVHSLQNGYDRRRTLQLLSSLIVAIPVAYMTVRQLPWQRWRADVATSTGEQKTINLPDGSQITLNTNSAIDIVFNNNYRRIRLLAGEVLITTHKDPAVIARPFVVDTPCGVVHALGTQFSVRKVNETNCHLAVFEHSVEIRTLAGSRKILPAGEQTHFTLTDILPSVAVSPSAILWQKGMLLVKDMRLGDVIHKLAQYRSGVLRCDAAVSNLLVSGSLSLTDTDASLALLQKNLPIEISYLSPYWVTVKQVNS